MYLTNEKIVTLNVIKKFCMQARNIFTNLSPKPARPEKPGPTYTGIGSTLVLDILFYTGIGQPNPVMLK